MWGKLVGLLNLCQMVGGNNVDSQPGGGCCWWNFI